MKYRYLGSSGLQVSEIALGTWLTYGDAVDEKMAHRIIRTAVDNGVNFIDLADVYAYGQAETVTGRAIRPLDRTKLVISSKVYWPMSDDVNDQGLSRKHIMESIDKSLRRIGTDYLDIYFCHRFDENTPVEEVVRAMDDLIHQGKVLYWGTSVWDSGQIQTAVDFANDKNLYRPQAEQPRYNMFDRRIEDDVMQTTAKNGLGLTVFSPLAQGLLSGKYNNGVPEDSRGAQASWLTKEVIENDVPKVSRLADLASQVGISMAQLALGWILRRPEISSAIIGASKEKQLLENVEAADLRNRITEDVVDEVELILAGKQEEQPVH